VGASHSCSTADICVASLHQAVSTTSQEGLGWVGSLPAIAWLCAWLVVLDGDWSSINGPVNVPACLLPPFLPSELDFMHEATNSARCASNLDSRRSRVRGRVAVPGVDLSRTSHRVLTMEFVDGGLGALVGWSGWEWWKGGWEWWLCSGCQHACGC
jgi:hypothetical protein